MPGRWRVCVCVCARGGGRSPFCNVLANSSAACLVLTSTTQHRLFALPGGGRGGATVPLVPSTSS
jgi:hypothetical protein